MSTAKLFVGSLPYSIKDEELAASFAKAGTVESAKVITDRDSGMSKGFGFVEMASEEEAQNAIKMFHGHSIDESDAGRRLTVNKAKPMTDRPRTESRGRY